MSYHGGQLELNCSWATLGDIKECASELSQLRNMGHLSTNTCQPLVQGRLYPRAINSLAFPVFLATSKNKKAPEARESLQGKELQGLVTGQWAQKLEQWGDMGGYPQLLLQGVWISAVSSTGHAAGIPEALTERKWVFFKLFEGRGHIFYVPQNLTSK